MSISRITCKVCGQALKGAPGDVAFACRDCGKVRVFWTPPLAPDSTENGNQETESQLAAIASTFQAQETYPLEVLDFPEDKPGKPGFTEKVRLPFWLFTVRPRFEADQEKRVKRYQAIAEDLYPMVPAYAFHGHQYVGWPGTDLDPLVRLAGAKGPDPVFGIARDPLTAYVLAWFFVYRRADHLSDVSNVGMTFEHRATTLLAVAARLSADRVSFPFSDREYPSLYFDDLETIYQLTRNPAL